MNDDTLLRARSPLASQALPDGGLPAVSAVSWAAILAGATAAAALSLILLVLGTGLGLSAVSPWSGQGAGGAAFGLATIAWLTFTQIAAAGMGGYLAGRLRVRWASTHGDEVYFRDTAHGFLAWAVATLVTAATLASAIGAVVGNGVQAGVQAGASPAAGAATAAVGKDGDAQAYVIDSLFRSSPIAASASAPASASVSSPTGTDDAAGSHADVGRIFANALLTGALPADDMRHVAQRMVERTGVPRAEAEQRVSAAFDRLQSQAKNAEANARSAADTARKASARGALWMFVSLLIGAFCASWAATYGGRRRDAF